MHSKKNSFQQPCQTNNDYIDMTPVNRLMDHLARSIARAHLRFSSSRPATNSGAGRNGASPEKQTIEVAPVGTTGDGD